MNGSGTIVVEYTYDAWGYIRNTTGSLKDTLGKANALRYRGYVYDTETCLYYLQSRYYNPGTGRFINADALIATGQGLLGNNMFAYCNNNPVVAYDPMGYSPRCFPVCLGGNGYQRILNQNDEVWSEMELGEYTIGYGGCGAIAIYNALISLGNPLAFHSVLQYFNEDTSRLFANGKVGILPEEIVVFFESMGYTVRTTARAREIEQCSKTADACIMFYIFPRKYKNLLLPGGHFVEYVRIDDYYVGHNTINDVDMFNSPVDFGLGGSRFYMIGIFIYRQD